MFKRIFCGLGLTAFLMGAVIVGNTETYYNSVMTVTDADATTRTVTIVDKTGNVWAYYVPDNDIPPCVGSEVVCKMHNNHTASPYDDEIVRVRMR